MKSLKKRWKREEKPKNCTKCRHERVNGGREENATQKEGKETKIKERKGDKRKHKKSRTTVKKIMEKKNDK